MFVAPSSRRRRLAVAKFIGGSLLTVVCGGLLGVAIVWGATMEFDRRCSVGIIRGAEDCPPHRAEGRWGKDGKWNWQLPERRDNA